MISTRNTSNALIKKKREKKKILTTRDIKLPEKEPIDREKIKKTKSLNMSVALGKNWGRKNK